MKPRFFAVIAVIACLVGTTMAFASGSSGGTSSGSSSSSTSMSGPSTALDWYNVGYAAANAGKYQEGVNDFQKAIALKSDYAEAYNMLGFCTRKLGNVKAAFTYYEKALSLKPNFPEAREYYGEAFLQEGNLARAVQQYVILFKAGSKNAAELLDQISDYVNKNAAG
jgi:tetratricopeptide (TPR) repeat protein